MASLYTQVQSFVSKKLIIGPAAATALLTNGNISSIEWVAVTLGYLVVQGLVDYGKSKKVDQGAAFSAIANVLSQLPSFGAPIDQQDKITPMPK